VARLEKELPEGDRDRYQRAYVRGRTQARSKYLAVGIAAGIGAGIVAAILLDPKHGKERREAIAQKTSSLTKSAGRTVAGKAKYASDRARGVAIERGMLKPPAADPALEVPAGDEALETDNDTVAEVVQTVGAVPGTVDDAVTGG
jgi:gas vesicle protein